MRAQSKTRVIRSPRPRARHRDRLGTAPGEQLSAEPDGGPARDRTTGPSAATVHYLDPETGLFLAID